MAGISNNPNSPRQRMISLMSGVHRHDGTERVVGGAGWF